MVTVAAAGGNAWWRLCEWEACGLGLAKRVTAALDRRGGVWRRGRSPAWRESAAAEMEGSAEGGGGDEAGLREGGR